MHVGSLSPPATNGSTVTVNTFPGDLSGVVFFAAPYAASDSTTLTDAGMMFGVLRKDGVSQEQYVVHAVAWDAADSPSRAGNRNNECVRMGTTSSIGTVIATGAFVANGFQLTFSATNSTASGHKIYYLAFEDEIGMDVVTLTSPASPGTVTVTGLASQPTAIIKFISQLSTTLPSTSNTSTIRWGMGFTDGTTEIGATWTYSMGGASTAVGGWMTDDYGGVQGNTTTQVVSSYTSSLTSDGWVETYDTTPGSGYPMFAIAIWGKTAKVTSFQTQTTTGAQSVRVEGLTPQSALFFSNGLTAKETFGDASRGGVTFAEFLFGATDGSDMGVVWTGVQDATTSSTALYSRFASATRVLDFRHPSSGGSTRIASAVISAFIDQEVQLSWSDNTLANQPWVAVLALGAAYSAPPPSSGNLLTVLVY